MIAGVDVSHYNGTVDWQKLATAGIQFAYIKASEGRRTKDVLYPTNYASAQQNQILRGAYHFFYPQLDANAQADNFLAVVSSVKPGDLPPVLDVEVSGEKSPSAIAQGVQQWLDQVEETLGIQPIIYTASGFWNAALGGTDAFSAYSLWIAHYTTAPLPTIPNGFADYLFWQYSQSGTVPGIDGSVDQDWFNGTSDDLTQLAS